MTALLAAAVLLQAQAQPSTPVQPVPPRPNTVTFPVLFSGDPFDPDQNDVRVQFSDGGSFQVERAAYFSSDYGWAASFLPPASGSYRARLVRNGKPTFEPERLVVVESVAKLRPVGVDPATQRLKDAAGQPWLALGLDLGDASAPNLAAIVETKAPRGGFIRIEVGPAWASSEAAGGIDVEALGSVDAVLDAAARAGVRVQLAPISRRLLAPGEVWASHPWNRANGGFLDSTDSLVSDPEVGRRLAKWARYAATRWGAHEALLAWDVAAAEASHPWRQAVVGAVSAAALPETLFVTRTSSGLEYGALGSPDSGAKAILRELAVPSLSDLADAVLGGSAGALVLVDTEPGRAIVANLASAIAESGFARRRSPSRREVRFSSGFRGAAVGESDWALAVFERLPGGPETCDIAGLGLADGRYEFEERDLLTGQARKGMLQVANFRLAAPFRPSGSATALTLRRAL